MLTLKIGQRVKCLKDNNEKNHAGKIGTVTAIYDKAHTPREYLGSDYRVTFPTTGAPSKYNTAYFDEDELHAVETIKAYCFIKKNKRGRPAPNDYVWRSSDKDFAGHKRAPEFDIEKEVL